MTKLERKVRREVERLTGRPWVVTLEPADGAGGARIAIHEKGKPSTKLAAPVGSVYVMLAERAANAKRQARHGARRVSLLTGRAR